jgi:colicin import membrane protein
MTITERPPAAAAGREPGACRYPGCPNPARDPGSPGRRPGYCDQEMPEDRDGTLTLVRHTALTAFRRRQQMSGQPDDGGRPVTAAISRAGSIRDDALAAMSRLGAQLTAALDQLAALGEQLAAAGPEAAEAQAEAVRAETAAQLEHARAETAGHAAARHAAELDAAEARTAAAEAIAMLEEHAAARQRAEDQRDAHAAELAAARDAASRHEQERQRHDDALAALRGQLARAEAALERERDRQHETALLLRGLIPGPETPAGKTTARRQPAAQ